MKFLKDFRGKYFLSTIGVPLKKGEGNQPNPKVIGKGRNRKV